MPGELRRLVGPVVVAALLAGCPGGDPPADRSNTTVLSPGAGPENAEPLWPMTPGWTGSGGVLSVVYDPIVLHGQELLRFAGPLPFLSTGGQMGPAEPEQWTFFSQSDEGLMLRGFLREGIWDAPILFLPTKVRAGMVWDARLRDGTLRYRFTVQSMIYKFTRFGPRRVWTLQIYDARSKIGIPDRITIGVTTTMDFIEGRGPIDADVVPLDPAPATMPPRIATRALEGGAPITGGLPTHFGGVARPADGDAIDLTLGLQIPYFDNTGEGPPMSIGVSATGCSRYTPGQGFAALPVEQCASPIASTVEADGQVLTLGCSEFEAAQQHCDTYLEDAVFTGADGKVYVHGSRFDRPNTLAWSEVTAPASQSPVCCAFSTIQESATAIFEPFGQSLRYDAFADGLWVAPVDQGFAVVGGAPDGYLGFGRLDPARGFLSDLHFAQASLRPLNWALSAAGHEAQRTYPDGRVELLTAERDGISVRTLDLDLPAGALLEGAIVHQGKLIAITSQGFRGNDAQFQPDGYDPAFSLDLGSTYAYEADLPANLASTPTARRAIHADRPDAIDENGVARVCVPPAVGPLSAEGWTMNGAPVRYAALSRDGSCVDVLFPPPALQTDPNGGGQPVQGDQDPYDLVGTIPTMGRVAVWPRMSATAYVGVGEAPLAGGGSISADGRIRDELGFLETVSDAAIFGQPEPAIADLAGAGLWGTTNGGQDLILIGRGATRRWPGLGPPRVAAAGGGVLVASGLLRATDAAPTALPATTFPVLAVLADGTQCGFAGMFTKTVACVDPAGGMHQSAPVTGTEIFDGLNTIPAPFFAVDDGLYVGLFERTNLGLDRVVRFNKDLSQRVDYGARVLGFVYAQVPAMPFVRFGPDGDAYLTVGDDLLAFRRDRIERAPRPVTAPSSAWGQSVHANLGVFVFDPGPVGAGPQQRDIKIPRAELVFAPIDPGAMTCPQDQHPCGPDCLPDGPDDITTGCRLTCGTACTPPAFATAVCTAGACDFACDAAHPRVGDACSCTVMACGALECGPPDCGSGISCGTCGNNTTCDAGHCTCPADAYEPDDVSGVLVTRLENTVHAATIAMATLTTPADVDRYSAYVMDPGFQNTALHFTATISPGASNLRLEVGFSRGGCSVSCAQGTMVSTAGVITCVATAAAAARTVEAVAQCPGNDDSGAFDMTVTAAGAISNCGAYGIAYSAVAQ